MSSPVDPSLVALSWSGGKDSAFALWELRRQGVEPVALLTTVTEDDGHTTMHGIPRALLTCQARAAGLPLVEVSVPRGCANTVYAERMAAALAGPPLDRVGTFAFGDLFLEDVRAYREERLAAAGRAGAFPLWGADTAALPGRFLAAGFRAVVVAVDPAALDACFVGRGYDAELLAALPAGVDPCGERGELHTFVTDGPVFSGPVAVTIGATVERDGMLACDIAPAELGST